MRLSEKLAAYAPPNIPNPNAVTPEALAESVRPVCRGCDGKLLPGQPDGAYCHRCAEETMAMELTRQDATEKEADILRVFAVGLVVGGALGGVALFGALRVFGWLS